MFVVNQYYSTAVMNPHFLVVIHSSRMSSDRCEFKTITQSGLDFSVLLAKFTLELTVFVGYKGMNVNQPI
jgi:hypothetical protein